MMDVCDQTNPYQQWLIQEFSETLAKQYMLLWAKVRMSQVKEENKQKKSH